MRKNGKRNPLHYKTYENENRREKNKLKRIVQSNGQKTAIAYATKYGLLGWLNNNVL